MRRLIFTLLALVIADISMAARLDLSAEETANCYMVGAGERYSFRADVKGNGVETLGLSATIDLKAVKGIKIIWEDCDIIDDASLKLSGNKILFTTIKGATKGNALIGIYADAACSEGQCIWSWHIWLTDAADCQIGGVAFLDRNLGAYGTTLGESGSNGCFWQWGRKEPFTASLERVNVCRGKKMSFAYAIANPNTFISRDGRWMDIDCGEAWRKEGQKTMLDPCPAGYCVPIYDDILALKKQGIKEGFLKAGAIWYDLDPSGQRMVGKAGWYWTSMRTPNRLSRSNDFYIWENGIGLVSQYYNASALCIRPQKIK